MPLTLLLSVPASVCPAFGGLAPGLIVFLAVFLWGLGTLGPGREWFLWSRFGLGLTGFLPRAFRCPWPPPGFPWKRKGVLKCNSFRSMCGVCVQDLIRAAPLGGFIPVGAGSGQIPPCPLLVLQRQFVEKDGLCFVSKSEPATVGGLRHYVARFNFTSRITPPDNPSL